MQAFKFNIENVVIPAIELFRTVLAGTIIGRINSLVNLFEKRIIPNLGKVSEQFGKTFPAAAVLGESALDSVNKAWAEFSGVLSGGAGGGQESATSAMDEVIRIINDDMVPALQAGLAPALEGITTIWERNLRPTFEEIVETWNVFLLPNLMRLAELFGTIWNAIFGVLDQDLNGMVKLIRGFYASILSLFQIQLDIITGVWQVALNILQGDWAGAWEDILRTAQNIGGTLGELFRAPANAALLIWEGLANGIIGAINAIIRAWNSLEFRFGGGKGPFGVEIPSFSVGTPDIPTITPISVPRLQSGAFVQRGGLAILDQGERVQPASVARGGGGGVTINVNFNATVSNERDLETQVTRIVNTALATGEIAV